MLISHREKGREISTPVLGNLSNGQTRHVMNSAGAELRSRARRSPTSAHIRAQWPPRVWCLLIHLPLCSNEMLNNVPLLSYSLAFLVILQINQAITQWNWPSLSSLYWGHQGHACRFSIAIFMSVSISKCLSATRVTWLEADTPLPLVILHCPHNNGLYLASGEAGIPVSRRRCIEMDL